jgi:hypothetical protein
MLKEQEKTAPNNRKKHRTATEQFILATLNEEK